MKRDPLETIRRLDPGFCDAILRTAADTFEDGALSAKVKYLIAMALDAAHGAAGGVTSLGRQAMEHGASREEIMEALKVASYVSGVGAVYTASLALADALG